MLKYPYKLLIVTRHAGSMLPLRAVPVVSYGDTCGACVHLSVFFISYAKYTIPTPILITTLSGFKI
jgi:hypothetical protein